MAGASVTTVYKPPVGVTPGVFTNDTGVALAIGDYVWLTGGVTPVLAADEEIADAPSAAEKAAGDKDEADAESRYKGAKKDKAYA
jgi:hypothetical protein